MSAKQVLPSIWRFDDQHFFSLEVGVYLIELNNEVVLFEIPSFSQENKDFVLSFSKPVKCYLSHGSTGIEAGEKWQQEIDLEIQLHKNDDGYSWLRIKPDVLFTERCKTEEYEIIFTPGHTDGSVCLLHYSTRTLFTGDTLDGSRNEIRDIYSSSHDDDFDQKIKSLRELLNYDFENILPFHYGMVIEGAKEKLEKALST